MMKIQSLVTLVVVLFGLNGVLQAEFVPHPNDGLAPDTIAFDISVAPDATAGQMNVQLDVYLFCDDNNVMIVSLGAFWDNPNLELDSAVLSPMAESAFDLFTILYDRNILEVSNTNQRFPTAMFSKTYPCLTPHSTRRRLASYYFTLSEWSETDSIVFDTLQFNPGTHLLVAATGEGDGVKNQVPYWAGRTVVYDTPSGCCVQRVGDADGQGGDEPTIGDLSVMVDALFISGYCDGIIACLAEADINLSGGADPTCDDITIGDYSILMDYLFITGSSLGLDDCY